MAYLALQIIKDLCNLNRNFCSSDYDQCLDYIDGLLPLKIYCYKEQTPYLGWQIPPKWDLIKGEIRKDGQLIFKAASPLDIIGLSKAFQGEVTLAELEQHLFYDSRNPEAVPYHFRQNYRPWERDWGFCVTKNFFESLEPGNYQVEIAVKESEGYLKVAEYTHQGSWPETFAFVAHLDHGGMANDDLAGVSVGIEAFHRLKSQKTKFTYKLILVQEIIGSAYYLGQSPEQSKHVREALFLEMLGSNTPLALQHSFKGETRLERILTEILREVENSRTGPFRSIICNDEMVWESFDIPMASLSRFPYPEYHSHFDNPSIISEGALNESVHILVQLIEKLDHSTLMRKKFQGVPALAHPHYNLYIDPGQKAFGGAFSEEVKNSRLLMDLIPIFPKEIFVEDIAEHVQMPADLVLEYLKKWQEKGLIELI